MKQSEFNEYLKSLLKKEDEKSHWEMKPQSPRKPFDGELLSSLLLEEFKDERVAKECFRTEAANRTWNIEEMKKGKPALRNYNLPKNKQARNDPTKEYSEADEVPPGAGDAREKYDSQSPNRMEKDYVNVAHMIYDYNTNNGGSIDERAKLKKQINQAVYNREVDFDSLPSVDSRIMGTRRTPSVKHGPKYRRKAYKAPPEGWIFNSGLCPGQAEATRSCKHSRQNKLGEITYGRLLRA